MACAGVYRFPYRDLTRLAALTANYWPEIAGRFFGQTGQPLQSVEAHPALCFAYWHIIDVTEFRDEARKSLESLLTMNVEELVAQQATVVDDRPVSEIAASMGTDWDAFEASLGMTRSTDKVE